MNNDTPPPVPDLDGAVRLIDWGMLRVEGEEAAAFLQGQLTQDVLQLGPDDARLAGYCSPKGRLLGTFVVWRDGPETIWLATSAELVPALVKRLSMYVLRAKCRVTDASSEVRLWGFAGINGSHPWHQVGSNLPTWGRADMSDGKLIRLPDGLAAGHQVARFLFVSPVPLRARDGGEGVAPEEDVPGEAALTESLSLDAWRWLEASSGIPRITAATSEHFVPQMVNLEALGGVDFRKGCYPGQEVVARSQYRGSPKRRAAVFSSSAALAPGTPVFHSEDPSQPAGEVVLAGSRSSQDHLAVVEFKMAAGSTGSLHAVSDQGPELRRVVMPYQLPNTAEV